jgi:tRNA threonylcarbamoyladenosine biosynthesis protein TsaB
MIETGQMTAAPGPLLAIETSGPTARVSLLAEDGAVLARAEKTAARHSSNLLPLCDEVLRAAGVRVGGLAAIACGAGPGSFTGLRVGLSVAKGLALPTGLPLILISSLEALAHDLAGSPETFQRALVIPCIDAGKDQVYARFFGIGAELAPGEWALAPSELAARARAAAGDGAVIIGGTGADRYRALLAAVLGDAAIRSQVAGPSADAVGALALERFRRGQTDDLGGAVPSYGRPPDITRPRSERL